MTQTRLEQLTEVFQAFIQDDIISVDITVQMGEAVQAGPPRCIDINLSDGGEKANVGALLQSILAYEISSVEHTLTQGKNILSWSKPSEPEMMDYRVKVQPVEGDEYKFYDVKAASADDALQIAFCLDGGVAGETVGLLTLAMMYAEVVK